MEFNESDLVDQSDLILRKLIVGGPVDGLLVDVHFVQPSEIHDTILDSCIGSFPERGNDKQDDGNNSDGKQYDDGCEHISPAILIGDDDLHEKASYEQLQAIVPQLYARLESG